MKKFHLNKSRTTMWRQARAAAASDNASEGCNSETHDSSASNETGSAGLWLIMDCDVTETDVNREESKAPSMDRIYVATG
jgi:hypothetical protein